MHIPKFFPGDLIEIVEADKMFIFDEDGGCRSKVVNPEIVGKQAILQGSYDDLYHARDNYHKKKYSIFTNKQVSKAAWYHEDQLKLVEPNLAARNFWIKNKD